jgi:hypothetical protein
MNGTVEWRSASTGKLLKTLQLSAGFTPGQLSPWSQIAISGNYGLVATHDDGSPDQPNHLFVIDLQQGVEVWRSSAFPGSVSCMIPILSDGIAVVGTYWNGTWHAFRLGDGAPYPFSGFANPRSTGYAPGALRRLTIPE